MENSKVMLHIDKPFQRQ